MTDSAARMLVRSPFRLLAWTAGVILVAVPAILIAWVLLGDYGAFFWDAKTWPCGIEAMIATGHPNAYLDPGYAGNCAGYRFTYTPPPAITAVLASLGAALGIDVLVAVYAALYAVALASLGRTVHRLHGSLAVPVLFSLSFACGIFVFETASGNVSIVFGGLLSGLILSIERRAGLVVALCVIAALFKPHYALYLLVPLLARGNYLAVSVAGAAVSLWYAADAVLHRQAFTDWLNLILPIVHGEAHFGFMKLMQFAGYAPGDWSVLAAGYAVWCLLVIGLTLNVCARLASPVDRAFAALACATLLLPRLKEYDCLVLVPLFFWLHVRSTDAQRRLLQRVVGVTAFVVPALWWWARKLPLITGESPLTLRTATEFKWLIQVQGIFVAAVAFIVFATVVATFGRRPKCAAFAEPAIGERREC